MKPFHIILVAVAVALAGGAWGVVAYLGQRTPAPAPRADTPPANQESPALIGTLRSPNHTIHLYAGRFSVEGANGQVLAHLVTEEGFSKLFPELFGEFQQMYAEGQLIADNRTHRELSTGWSYSARPMQVHLVPGP